MSTKQIDTISKDCKRPIFENNMKQLFFTVLFVVGTLQVMGQSHQIHMPLMDETWELISKKKYVKDSKRRTVPVFPDELVVKINTNVQLQGYIIPIKTGLSHQLFMLSILPSQQCPYCGTGDVPSLVEVRMKTDVTYTEKPIKVKGLFKLNESGNGESEVLLINAELVK